MPIIDVPGVGQIDFGDMKDAEIEAAIKQHLPTWEADKRISEGPAPGDYTEPFGGEAPSVATKPGEVEALKKGLYGSDALGSASSGLGGAVENIPLIGVPAKAGAQKSAAMIRSLFSGNPYADELKAVRDYSEKTEKEHSTAKTVGGVAGPVTMLGPVAAEVAPFMGLSPEVSLGANVVRAGGTGAAVEGTKALEEGKSPKEALTQAGVGAATFGAAPVLGSVVGGVVRKLLDKAATSVGPLATENPAALNEVLYALKADNLTTPEAIEARFNELGPRAFLAEYGPNTMGTTSALAAMPGSGKTAIFKGFGERAANAPDYVESAVTDAMGPRVNISDLTASGRIARDVAARPVWEAFESTQVHPTKGIKDLIAGTGEGADRVPGLEELGLLSDARKMAQLEAAATGKPTPPMENFFTTGERKDWPTTKSYQYVKQAIDERIENSKVNGRPTQLTRLYTMMKQRLDNTVEGANPEASAVWKQARKLWADNASLERAREAGQDLWNTNTRRDEIAKQFGSYEDPHKEAFRQGARDSLAEMMDASARGDTSVRNKLLAPANQDKLKLVAQGDADAEHLIRKMEQLKAQADTRSVITGNSMTAARQAAQQRLTPDPEELLTTRLRHMYSPHVTPGVLIPKAIERAAANRQAVMAEESRNAMAPWLMKQGDEAQKFAKALLAHEAATTPGRYISPAVDQYVRLLSMGAAPQATSALNPRAQSIIAQ